MFGQLLNTLRYRLQRELREWRKSNGSLRETAWPWYQKARKLDSAVIGNNYVQTTPHLFGWLLFRGHLSNADKNDVVQEHETHGGPLRRYFEEMYSEALRCRLMAR